MGIFWRIFDDLADDDNNSTTNSDLGESENIRLSSLRNPNLSIPQGFSMLLVSRKSWRDLAGASTN